MHYKRIYRFILKFLGRTDNKNPARAIMGKIPAWSPEDNCQIITFNKPFWRNNLTNRRGYAIIHDIKTKNHKSKRKVKDENK